MLDTHHHLWSYNADDYPWIPANTPLAQNQLLAELEEVTSAAGVQEQSLSRPGKSLKNQPLFLRSRTKVTS